MRWRPFTSPQGLPVAAHLTCVDASRQETLEIADTFARAGVQDIVALRGDPPSGQDRFQPHPDGFANSVELISALAETEMFSIRVGAYPDIHPEAQERPHRHRLAQGQAGCRGKRGPDPVFL